MYANARERIGRTVGAGGSDEDADAADGEEITNKIPRIEQELKGLECSR
jgi:hypothetical protein